MIDAIFVKMSKRLEPHFPHEDLLVAEITTVAARRLRERIEERGVDADGKPLPKLSTDRWWWTSVTDPRFGQGDNLVPRRQRGQKGGGNTLRVHLDGYLALKKKRGGKDWRGSSMTGAMWENLSGAVSRTGAGTLIKLQFRRSQRVGKSSTERTKSGKPRNVSVRNRDKAWALQYPQRVRGGIPKGPRQFVLMQLSAVDLGELRDMYMGGLELFKPGEEEF